VRSVLLSPRKRRRAAWFALTALALVATVVAGIRWPNTAEERPVEEYTNRQAQMYVEPEQVELTRRERAKALATAANFVTHAVARRKEAEAYDLAAPSLRAGISRAEWRRGNIPVVPFPVDHARWKLEYSYEKALGLQVLLFPPARSGLRPQTFDMELTPTGHGKSTRWLVSSWSPSGTLGGATGAAPATASTGAGGVPNVRAALEDKRAPLGAAWLLAPLALIALVPLTVLGFYIRGWRRGRRAEAAYRARQA
jgi:hypothetical protein